MTTFAIRDIKPNPFRHFERYPVRSDKVDALRESLRTTGFWDNVVARAIDDDGEPVFAGATDLVAGAEIAYGHHRLIALQEEFGKDRKVELILRDLDDTAMLQVMARENSEEWGADAQVEQETVRAVVEAYGAGLVELPAVPPKTRRDGIRHAPSFRAGGPVASPDHPYTAATLTAFLGWDIDGKSTDKAQHVLQALTLIEEGVTCQDDFKDLLPDQAMAVAREANRATKRMTEQGASPTKAKETAMAVAQDVAERLRSGQVAVKNVEQVTDKHVPKPLKEMDDFARKLASKINHVLNHDGMAERMDALLPYAADLGPIARRELVSCLRLLADRADHYCNQIQDAAPAERALIESEVINA